MNIFYLDTNPMAAARMLCDKHMKMALETAQILHTISHKFGVEAPYKATHRNHPSTVWAGNTLSNWQWLVQHGFAICDEYKKRYNKEHKCRAMIEWTVTYGGKPPAGLFETPPRCMPEQYKRPSVVDSYRAYYLGDKASFACWTHPGKAPSWWTHDIEEVSKKGKTIYKTKSNNLDKVSISVM